MKQTFARARAIADLQRIHDFAQAQAHSADKPRDLRMIDQWQHCVRVHELHPSAAGGIDPHPDVAGQQGTDLRLAASA